MLNEIFEYKREEVAAALALRSLADVRAEAESSEPCRGFLNAIRTSPQELALIAEVKKASPSQGLIRADFDPVAIAETYTEVGATALSVLTDSRYFQGSPEFLRRIRAATPIPLLRKDFIFDAYQVYEAKAWGADAILLIVAMLEQPVITELNQLAVELGLDVLVEVHDQAETERALRLGVPLIGVNNRDLSTFKTDLTASEVLIPQIAPHAVAISESALETYADLLRVKKAGASGVLIGTSFCSAPNIGKKVREVMNWGATGEGAVLGC